MTNSLWVGSVLAILFFGFFIVGIYISRRKERKIIRKLRRVEKDYFLQFKDIEWLSNSLIGIDRNHQIIVILRFQGNDVKSELLDLKNYVGCDMVRDTSDGNYRVVVNLIPADPTGVIFEICFFDKRGDRFSDRHDLKQKAELTCKLINDTIHGKMAELF